ncbi:MAG: hypothetical protein A3D44_01210 [Candidatus Staskawiczbacteria bacterium RIFCSPHIGHO2_02_FULL_42_22]|uniref:Uncharacterized protein n=1 Tax=Candidatus Staskawiczbacteria bacterium RIFCSPHIGHO2_02_FULL_42_22 TaxID=1802207 RepID=A0A1G2I387_9BACT|nr:MAG: hypothetical protein A3D44_01210 [Candidatus Staskawiczbacteria bacterium RIFCSPHIGHO2_02_FULL_42_22]
MQILIIATAVLGVTLAWVVAIERLQRSRSEATRNVGFFLCVIGCFTMGPLIVGTLLAYGLLILLGMS